LTDFRERVTEALESGWSFAGLYAVAADATCSHRVCE
jgi:hypothetical protein